MVTLEQRIDALLSPHRTRDLLIHIGQEGPSSTPQDLRELNTVELPDGTVFRLFAGPDSPLVSATSDDSHRQVWIWGTAYHPEIAETSLVRWVMRQVESGNTSTLSALQGLFVGFVLDKEAGVLHLLTDVLGLRPIYYRREGADIWISNRVGTKWDSETIPAEINMEALRSWTYFGYNASNGALLAGWKRPRAGAHLRISSHEILESRYHHFALAPKDSNAREITDRLIAAVEQSFELQTRAHVALKLSLSGGFDSRLLAAFASRIRHAGLRVIAVNGSDNYRDCHAGESTEGFLARRVCERLQLRLDLIELRYDPLSAFEEPFLLMADGFPITKQMIALVAGSGARAPVINGFLGDNLMRGSWDCINGKPEQELKSSDLLELLLKRHSQLPEYLLEKKRSEAITDWARAFLAEITEPFHSAQRLFVGVDLSMRQRFYMSNNFLQHLDLCEPILPFATAELVQLKLFTPNGRLSFESFRDRLGRHFPQIADIPHTQELARPSAAIRMSAHTKRRWAIDALTALRYKYNLRAFNHRKLFPRLSLAVIDGRYEFVSETAMRFLVMESLLERLGLDFDWNL